MEEAAHLKWTNFQDNLNNTLKSLKESPDFIDVTLACEDGKKIGVHRAILAASSPLFQSLLNDEKNDHQMVYLTGVKSEDVYSVVDFMYCGETKVRRTNVDSFLDVTNDLKLEGLFGKSYINDDEEMFTISDPLEEHAKVMQSSTGQMTEGQKYVSEGAQQTVNDSKGEDFMQEAEDGEKEEKGKRKTEDQKETEEEENKDNARNDKKSGEQEKEKPAENKEENKREIEKEKQKEGENAIEKIDDIEIEREMSKKEKEIQMEKERQREKEQEREKQNEKERKTENRKDDKAGNMKENGQNVKENGENMMEKEQTVTKKTEAKIKDTDEKINKMCKMCRETFTSSQIYREHKSKAHNIECPLQKTCKLRFVVDYYKILHLYKAHKIGSKPWESLRPNKEESVSNKLVDAPLFGPGKSLVCKKCKKHFNNKDQQKHHEGLGHNYSCEKCDRSYIAEAAFKDHKLTHVRKTISSPTKVATQPSLIAVEKRTFLCDQCDKNFTDRQQLRKHETKEHQTRCKAKECNLTFGTHFTTRCIPRN